MCLKTAKELVLAGLARTEALRGKAGKKDESAKERITTVNFAFNATGTIKTPLQVINKSKKPKCFLAKHNAGVTWDPKKHGITIITLQHGKLGKHLPASLITSPYKCMKFLSTRRYPKGGKGKGRAYLCG